MKGYICLNCKNEIDLDPTKDRILCPKCSGRVILKKRPEIAKKVIAR